MNQWITIRITFQKISWWHPPITTAWIAKITCNKNFISWKITPYVTLSFVIKWPNRRLWIEPVCGFASLLSAFMQTSQPTNYNNNSFPFKYFAFTSVIRNTSWSKVFIVFMNFCKWKVFFNTKIQKLKWWGMFKIIIYWNRGLNFS